MGARIRAGEPARSRPADGLVERLRFDTLDEAKAFALAHGLEYTLNEPHARSPKAKSYADNFRYDRVRS
jgi:hypothetical protein